MKLLKDILYKVDLDLIHGDTNIAIPHICFDSREVKQNSLFIAVSGTLSDGHQYINNSIEAGAFAIVCEELPKTIEPNIVYVKVKNSSTALGIISSNFYDNPSDHIKLIGVTGTNGKTTVATILYNLFQGLGYKSGLISTVVYKVDKKSVVATHTTPDAIQLNRLLKHMVDMGCTYCFMEVSSHAIEQERIAGLSFDIALFTNISRDHLDYHKTFNKYIAVKKKFFDQLSSKAISIVNKDDKHGPTMVQNTKAKKKYFALRSLADYTCKIVENQFSGLHLNIDGHDMYTKLLGHFNAANLLLAYATALELNKDALRVLTVLSAQNAVDGRFQQVSSNTGIRSIVDYAHTPDALKNVLKTISSIRTGQEKVVCIIGCGGDRDKGKRPLMAQVACKGADQVILTSDNPRNENPLSIIDEMKKGLDPVQMKKVLTLEDRKEAIKLGVTLCTEGDILLVAGKGHEKYQEIHGERLPFDDIETLKEYLNE